MATGASIPRGFAPHHLGPPPPRAQAQQRAHHHHHQQQQQQQQGSGGMFAAPSLIKRPGAAVPSVLTRQAAGQRQSNSAYGLQQQYQQQQYQFAGQQLYSSQSSRQGPPSSQWDYVDSSSDSIAPSDAYSPPSSYDNGLASNGRLSPSQIDMNEFTHYQQQTRSRDNETSASRSLAMNFPSDTLTPRVGMRGLVQGQRAAAPAVPASDDENGRQYVNVFRSEIDDDTSLIRSEADKIAQRLLKTEMELERLKRQGDLIGESLRRQRALDLESGSASSNGLPSSPQYTKQQLEVKQVIQAASQQGPGSPNQAWSAPAQQRTAAPLPQKQTPTRGAPQPSVMQRLAGSPPPAAPLQQSTSNAVAPSQTQKLPAAQPQPVVAPQLQPAASPQPQPAAKPQRQPAHLGYPMPPEPKTSLPQTKKTLASLQDLPSHPALNNEQLAQAVMDDEQAAALGLPKGSMWFDPSDPAQMKMIKDQIEGNTGEVPVPPGPKIPPKPKAPRKTRFVKEDDLPTHKKLLHVPDDCDSEARVIRCYKRLAPAAHPSAAGGDVSKLAQLTDSCQACLAELRGKATSKVGELNTIGEEEEENEEEEDTPTKKENDAPEGYIRVEEVDPVEFYDEIFFHKTKHAQLKVTRDSASLYDF
jgi:hypothetical protein